MLIGALGVLAAAAWVCEGRPAGPPAERDFVQEWTALLGVGGSPEGVRAWEDYSVVTAQVSGAAQFATVGMRSFTDLPNPHPEWSLDIYDAVEAAAERREDVPRGLAAAGREFLAALERSGLAKRLDALGEQRVFTPRVSPAGLAMPWSDGEIMGLRTAKLARLRMVCQARRGEVAAVQRSLRTCLALSTAAMSDCTIRGRTTGCGIVSRSLEALLDAHGRAPLDAATARGVLEVLRAASWMEWGRTMDGGRLAGLNAMDEMYRTGSLLTLEFDLKSIPKSDWGRREELEAFCEGVIKDARGLLDAEAAAAGRAGAAVEAAVGKLEHLRKDPAYAPAHWLRSLPVLAREERRMRTLRGAAEALMAIEAYRAANGGRAPTTLAALVPEYLPAAPVDWLAADRRPIAYRLAPPDGGGPGFVLYGVGLDGQDHGGTVDPAAVRDGLAKGTDAVYSGPATPR